MKPQGELSEYDVTGEYPPPGAKRAKRRARKRRRGKRGAASMHARHGNAKGGA